ncbi:hypothetical protein PYW08_009394 [Mythimna loreyi]|uniref:Uncharacterized protein n=1 Tax=Mythimna loreyi TaxID=667449 RepID=A0ACC2Q907_9NEOP|nr:hypothetical protein PYW08_009394 [Mythimna loreyi]
MSLVKRTPPKTTQTKSESDITTAVLQSDYVNKNRNKRPREDNSPQSESKSTPPQSTIQDKLAAWKKEQDNNMAKFMAEQTSIMSKLASDIGEIKAQNVQIQTSNAEFRKTNEEMIKSMVFMNKKFEDMKKEVEDLRKERQVQHLYIQSLEQKITDLQRMSRGSGIELRNIPMESSENTDSLIKTVCNISKLVGLRLAEPDFRDIHRLPGKSTNSNNPRPVLVEFTKVKTKQVLLSAIRSYNKEKGKEDKLNTKLLGMPGERKPVYIEEQLSATTKKLFYQAREYAKQNSFKYCWTSNGNIFLRKAEGDKQQLINSEKCLQAPGSKNL